MIALIIGILLLILGIYLIRKSYDWEITGTILTASTGFFLVFHIPVLLLKEYNHYSFLAEGRALQQSLNDSREFGSELEAAAILTTISSWNIKLEKAKYDNTTFWLDQYIHDDIMEINPIK